MTPADLRTEAGRRALAQLAGGACLEDKLNLVNAVLDVIAKRHVLELQAKPAAWAAVNIAAEKIAHAEFVIRTAPQLSLPEVARAAAPSFG